MYLNDFLSSEREGRLRGDAGVAGRLGCDQD